MCLCICFYEPSLLGMLRVAFLTLTLFYIRVVYGSLALTSQSFKREGLLDSALLVCVCVCNSERTYLVHSICACMHTCVFVSSLGEEQV